MSKVKPMAVLQDGIQTLPAAVDRLIELHDGERPITAEQDAEITALLQAMKRLTYNLKDIMDVIM